MADTQKPQHGNRNPSYRLTAQDAAIIKKRIRQGEFLHRIAADFDVNPGRVSEIKTGRRFGDVPAAL